MTKQHYVIYLDNYALPGICSGVKDYFGTIEEMKEFILALKKDGHFSKTVEAFDKYLAGDTKAMHYACYTQQLLMNRAKCLATRNQYVESKKWEFLNTFGFPYTMSFESAGVRIAMLVWNQHALAKHHLQLFRDLQKRERIWERRDSFHLQQDGATKHPDPRKRNQPSGK